jgi:hypothetical protein
MTLQGLAITSLIVTVCGAGFFLGIVTGHRASANTQGKGRVFEIRTYTTEEGRLDALHARFRNHTMKLFEKHKITSIGYWTPEDAPLSHNTLIYVLVHPSREAATKNWAEFQADPEWVKARADSIKDGPLTTKTPDSVFMDPVDFSPIK